MLYVEQKWRREMTDAQMFAIFVALILLAMFGGYHAGYESGCIRGYMDRDNELKRKEGK